MVCQACGTPVVESVHFCPKCGAQVVMTSPGQPQPPMYAGLSSNRLMPMYVPRVQRNLQTLGILWCVLRGVPGSWRGCSACSF